MGLKPFDETLVTLLKAVPSIVARCKAPYVYHMEAYKNLTNSVVKNTYPCVVIQLNDDSPHKELTGNSGLFTAIYTAVVLSKESEDIRYIATEIKDLGLEASNSGIHTAYSNIEWVQVDSDSEDCEFAIEQQEKGIKTATLNIIIDHWGTT